jgi:hypothetical protein
LPRFGGVFLWGNHAPSTRYGANLEPLKTWLPSATSIPASKPLALAAQPQPAPFVQPVAAPTPTQQIVDDANRIEYTTDSLGRTLGVTRINAKLRRRVLGAMSPENGEKGQLLFMSMIACACVSIDGVPVPFPMQEFTLNALIDRLEQEGMDAIGLCIAQKFPQVKRQELKN